MALRKPSNAPDAIPTPQGWRHPVTGELLKAQKITAAQIAEYYAQSPTQTPVQLNEAPPNNKPVDQWDDTERQNVPKDGLFTRFNPFGN